MRERKTKAQLLKYAHDETKVPTGLERHYLNVVNVLEPSGVEIETIEFGIPGARGLKNLLKEGFFGPLVRTLQGRGKVDVYHATYEMLGVFFPFVRAKRIVSIHHMVNKDEGNGRLWHTLWRISSAISMRFADHVLAISSKTRDDVVRRYGIPSEKVTVVTFPQDPAFRVLGLEKGKVLGSMGTLNARKNHQAAIRVFSEVLKTPGNGDCVLRIVGKGLLLDELKELVSSLGVSDRVSFESDLPLEGLVEFYNTCAAVLNTSSKEGLGLATLEAQACGTPVVFFRDADIPPEVTEAAVPCADEAEMVAEVVKILNDPDHARRLIERGLEFTSADNGFREKLLRLYEPS
ncbi:MAG: glycosyltransferase family 4 protein [Thermoplasmatales archaeon]|nr:glycosyltransferase family 4 protein [Thermoplasmatales archaeon]